MAPLCREKRSGPLTPCPSAPGLLPNGRITGAFSCALPADYRITGQGTANRWALLTRYGSAWRTRSIGLRSGPITGYRRIRVRLGLPHNPQVMGSSPVPAIECNSCQALRIGASR